jgi:hypothetical protein
LIASKLILEIFAMGLVIGQPKAFFELLQDLAAEADAANRKLIMPVVLLVRVIECAGTGTGNGADPSAFASSGQGADRRSASCTNAHTLGRVCVTFVPNVLLIGAVVSRSRKVSRGRSEKKTH